MRGLCCEEYLWITWDLRCRGLRSLGLVESCASRMSPFDDINVFDAGGFSCTEQVLGPGLGT